MADSGDDIAERMQHVRKNVGEDVKGIVENARTLADWRYHVKHHPWLCVGVAAALGYLVVPKRKPVVTGDAKELLQLLRKGDVHLSRTGGLSDNRGLVKTLLATAAPALMRGAMNLAANKLNLRVPASDFSRPTTHDMSAP